MQEETKIQGKLKYLFSKRDESIPLAADPTITIHTSDLQNRVDYQLAMCCLTD